MQLLWGQKQCLLVLKLRSPLIFKMFLVTSLLGLERISGGLGVWFCVFCNFCFYGGKSVFFQHATHSTFRLTRTPRHKSEG